MNKNRETPKKKRTFSGEKREKTKSAGKLFYGKCMRCEIIMS